jgi:hypothetical protein
MGIIHLIGSAFHFATQFLRVIAFLVVAAGVVVTIFLGREGELAIEHIVDREENKSSQ